MSQERTPGPWTRKDTRCYESFYGGYIGTEHWVLGPNGEELACPDLSGDADLMTACLDMLDVLEVVADQITYMQEQCGLDGLPQGLADRIRSVIAKAKGDGS